MPDVVVGALLRDAGPHRQHRRGAVQRLDLGFLVHAEHHRLVRRVQVQPDHVADLGVQPRVGGELEALRPPRLQAPFPPDVRDFTLEMPSSAASSRDDQCVTPSRSGGGSSVASTIATSRSTAAGPASAGPPARRYPRRRTASSRRSPSAWTPRPGARSHSSRSRPPASSTILARCASPARIDGDRTHEASTSRSRGGTSTFTVNGMNHRPPAITRSQGFSLTEH